MDTKNDDSGGSDSLDKSLQKKCVVDDMGQGEGTTNAESSQNVAKIVVEEQDECFENSAKKQKTENSVGDGSDGNGVNAIRDAATSLAQLQDTILPNTSILENAFQSSSASTSTSAASNRASPNNNGNNAFETKVKQISKNLKETTLAESVNKKTSLEDNTSSSSSSSECGAVTPSSSSTNQPADLESSLLETNESIDEHDSRSKKVRFHPDVKENDGGNRVIPKKKKKLKNTASGDDGTTGGQRTTGADDDMELDEEDDGQEEEEEFDLAKTIAEAQDYLKSHPLTFVCAADKIEGRLQNGLLDEEDMPQLSESSEEEDFYENVPAENGVERILGKQTKCGKVEFLLRFADKPGLHWETEEFIWKQCPNMLNRYEQNRERRQERLMRHVAKRQNVRQRYTDF